jgi:transposase
MDYGKDRRGVVLRMYDQGKPAAEVSAATGYCKAWCRRIRQFRHEPRRRVGGGRPKLDAAARAVIAGWVDARPDLTLEQLRQRIQAELGVAVSIGTVWNVLRAMKLTLKKSRSTPPSRPGRTSPRPARRSPPASPTSQCKTSS